ncbi:MAG: transketolase family protein [Chloroflexi bacterium]|nr:transketolase family protein [Chloroflexota bacterium]
MTSNMPMRNAYGIALADYGEINPDVMVLDVDTCSSTQSCLFGERFPERFLNIGIAEPCLIDVAVGLALGGMIPFANGFSALLALRAVEQIRTCVCYARTNVKIAAGYAGVSDYKDGPTHHSIMDIATMRAMPEMRVIVPADAVEAAKWVPLVAESDGPVYLRVSRAATLPVHDESLQLEIGKGITLRDGGDVTVIATGSMVGRSLLAAQDLAVQGIGARVVEIHTIKPLDVDTICRAAEGTGAIVTAEEHSIVGGLGGAVAEVLSEHCPTPLERVGIRDTFTRTAPDPESLMDAFGLAVTDIVAAAKQCLARK